MSARGESRSIAYGILCHDSAERVAAQFRYIWSPESLYFYHVDAKAGKALHGLVAALQSTYDNVFAVPSILCSWGGFSMVEAMLSLTRRAIRGGGAWSHLVFLSEQHLPLSGPRRILASLEVNNSYARCRPAGAGAGDILNRFAWEYYELPGVGAFAVKPRSPPGDIVANVYHGSQWMVLSRKAAAALSEARRTSHWDQFRRSLLADETAIQTWLYCHDDAAVGRRVLRDMTFVASPSVGGSYNQVFSEQNFFDAIAKGHLFLRKRPDVLPEVVLAHLETMIPSAASVEVPWPPAGGEALPAGAETLAEAFRSRLNDALRETGTGVVLHPMPRDVHGPSFFCVAEGPAASLASITTFVLSSDLTSFKVVAVLQASSAPDEPSQHFRSFRLGPYETTLLRIRAHDIAFEREIHLSEDLSGGFVTIDSIDDLGRLAGMVSEIVRRASEFRQIQI